MDGLIGSRMFRVKLKLPSIPVKEWISRAAGALVHKLPRVNLSPLTERFAPLTARLKLGPARKFLGPAALVIALAIMGGVLIRLLPAMSAVAIPDELTRLRLVAGQEVILWHAMNDTASSTLTEFVDEFNATNRWGITIVPQNQGTYTRLRERLDSALQRGATPDLVVLYPQHASAYAARADVIAFDDYISSPQAGLTRAELDDFLPGLLEGERNPQLGNQLASFPIGPDAMVLVYNVDWLRSIGYQDPPQTWEIFNQACAQAMADTDGDTMPDTFGYAFVADVPTFSAMMLTRGQELLSQDGSRVLFNTPEGERAMRTLRDAYSSKCAYTAPGRDWDRGDFTNAKVLFNIVPSSALPAYHTIIGKSSIFRWGVSPLPHNGEAPITPLSGQNWTLFKSNPDRQLAAWLFIRWFSEPSQTQRWASANYTLPLRRSAITTLEAQPDLEPTFKRVIELAPYGRPEPSIAKWDDVGKIVLQAMRAVAGGMAPKEALNQAEQAANAALQGGAP